MKACAREGLVSLEVVAGDGTKLKASASMAANVTAEELEAQIAELEELIDSGVRLWVAEHFAFDDADATAAAPRRAPGGDGPGGGAGTSGEGGKKTPKRAAMLLERRKATRGQLSARQGGPGRIGSRAGWRPGPWSSLSGPGSSRPRRTKPWPWRGPGWRPGSARRPPAAGQEPARPQARRPDAGRDVIRTRKQAARDRGRAEAAAAAGMPAAAARVNTTEWASRVMPLKKGGFDQLVNAQALAAARSQVILAVMRHDNFTDTGALHPLLEQAGAVLDAAGIRGPIGKAVFDTGYASDANFTTAAEAVLYVALARESVQAGRSGGRQPQSALSSWQDMAARLDTPEGRAVYKKRAATIEPVFAQLVNRLVRALNYRGDKTGAELSCGPPATTCSRPSPRGRPAKPGKPAPPGQRPSRPLPDHRNCPQAQALGRQSARCPREHARTVPRPAGNTFSNAEKRTGSAGRRPRQPIAPAGPPNRGPPIQAMRQPLTAPVLPDSLTVGWLLVIAECALTETESRASATWSASVGQPHSDRTSPVTMLIFVLSGTEAQLPDIVRCGQRPCGAERRGAMGAWSRPS